MCGKILFFVSVSFISPLPMYGAPYFYEGVSESSGYYDYNKKSPLSGISQDVPGNGIDGYDGMLCWAASASNLIQWWQTSVLKNVSDNGDASLGSVNAPVQSENTYAYNSNPNLASNIFGYFAENWHDDGDSTANAFRWYINGHTKVRGGVVGGYYDGGKSYLKNLSAPSGFYKNSYFSNSEIKVVTAKNLQSVLCQSVKSDNATMLAVMPTNGGGGHAVTFWGYEKTSSGFKIYITDSDDGEKGMKSYMLTKKTNYGGYEFWVIDNYVSGTEYVVAAIQSMSLLGVNQKGKLYRLKKIAATAGVLPLGAAGALETEPDSPEINVCETLEVEPDARIDIDIDFLDYSDLYFADNIVKVKNWDESSKLWVNFSFEDDDGDFLDALMSEGASVDFLAYTDGCDLALSDFSLFNADINGFFFREIRGRQQHRFFHLCRDTRTVGNCRDFRRGCLVFGFCPPRPMKIAPHSLCGKPFTSRFCLKFAHSDAIRSV